MIFLILLFIFLVFGGWYLFTSIFDFLFNLNSEKEKYTFNTTHVHHHYHEHKNISIIDDETKQKIFELKESKDLHK